ncbi:MAG: 16S rRNA (guanine(527)-N(7))-methyltransferase RsmG, partial [Burkholderiales bacterium]|nr:16S rRNA (guanine(527)-N(7))-methyltransferase RsmG [Burkholderiales bacterium]
AKLIDYIGLLAKWNKVHNLTAIRRQEQMISHHLLDSLAILPALEGKHKLLDVGSGGGLPGIPLALVESRLKVTLLDSSHKKTAFLRQSKAELGLTNVEVACARVEAWRPAEKFDVIVSRAFADLAEFAASAGWLLAPGGQLLAMKGVYPFEEIAALHPDFQVSKVVSLQVPGLDAARHLVILNKAP